MHIVRGECAMNRDFCSTFFIDFNEMCVAKCVSAAGSVSFSKHQVLALSLSEYLKRS